MKPKTAKQYKRQLSRAAIEAMSAGGSRGTIEQKREAGKLGWRAMVKLARLEDRLISRASAGK